MIGKLRRQLARVPAPVPGASFPDHRTAALLAAALTLSLLVPHDAAARALQTLGVAALLPALGLSALVRSLAASRELPRAGSAAFFALLITLSSFAVDPGVPDEFDTPKMYLLLAASAVLLPGYAVWHRRHGSALRFTAIELVLAGLLAWGVVVNPQWPVGEQAIWFWLSLALLLITWLTRQLFASARAQALDDFFTALWLNGVVLAVLGFRQAFDAGTFGSVDGLQKTSMTSMIGIANAYGAFLAAGVIGATVCALRARSRFARMLLAAAALVQLGALLANGSRGAMLGLLTGLALTAWLRVVVRSFSHPTHAADRSRRVSKRTLIVVGTGLAVLGALALTAGILYRLNPASSRGRLIAWEISARMAADDPLTGVGSGRFGAEFGRYQAALWRDPQYARWSYQAFPRIQPHNEFLLALTERGVPGLFLLALLWIIVMAASVKALAARASSLEGEDTDVASWGLVTLLLCVLTHATVDYTFHWLPTMAAVHLAFGLVPARVRLSVPNTRAVSIALLVIGCGYAGLVGFKVAREYAGHVAWHKGTKVTGRRTVEWLTLARGRLPGEGKLDLRLGNAWLAVGRPDSAIPHLERGLQRLDDIDFRLALARANLLQGRLSEAERHARAAADGFPDRLGPQLVLARIYHAAGNHEAARVALTRCIRRVTHVRSVQVDAVAARAEAFWRASYSDPPPR